MAKSQQENGQQSTDEPIISRRQAMVDAVGAAVGAAIGGAVGGAALVASTSCAQAAADAALLKAFPGFIYKGSTHDLALDLGPGGVVEVSHPEGCRVRLDDTGTVVDIRSPFLMDLVYDAVVEEIANGAWHRYSVNNRPIWPEQAAEDIAKSVADIAQGVVDRLRLALGIPE